MDILKHMNENDLQELEIVYQRYTVVYKRTSEFSVHAYRVVPKFGYYVFFVSGIMSSRLSAKSYIIARTKKEARSMYRSLYGWKPSTCRIVTGDEFEAVLSNPMLPL